MHRRVSHNNPLNDPAPCSRLPAFMTPNRRKIQYILLILAITLTACTPAKPPTADIDAAASALTAARKAGAPTYAPLELRAAQDHLNQARASVDNGDYDVALRLASQSRVDSELATVKARLGKDREKVQKQILQNAKLRRDLNLDGHSPQPVQQ